MNRGALIGLLMLLGLSCINDDKIDQTNSTLEANLEELKRLNKNFVTAAKNVEDLQIPVVAISEQFGKLIYIFAATQNNFAQFIEVGTLASRQALALMSVMPVEKINEYGNNLDNLLQQIAAFNLTLTEQA